VGTAAKVVAGSAAVGGGALLAWFLLRERQPDCVPGYVWDEATQQCIPIVNFGTLEGYVYDEDDAPVAGATVLIGSISLLSDIYGKFRQSYLAPGSYILTVSKTGYITKTSTVTVTAGEITTVDVTLAMSDGDGGEPTCPDGQVWDPVQQKCVCPGGQVWDTRLLKCVCPSDQTWDPVLNKCVCPGGKVWDQAQQKCVCPEGQIWNGAFCVDNIPTIRVIGGPKWVDKTQTLEVKLNCTTICDADPELCGPGYYCNLIDYNKGMDENRLTLEVTDIFGNPMGNYGHLAVYFDDAPPDVPGVHGQGMAGNKQVFWARSSTPVLLPYTDDAGITKFYVLIPKRPPDTSKKDVRRFHIIDTLHSRELFTGLVSVEGDCGCCPWPSCYMFGFIYMCVTCQEPTLEWSVSRKWQWSWSDVSPGSRLW